MLGPRHRRQAMVIDLLILTQYIVTALSSGFNAAYFSGYRSPLRRRRIGALALALLSVAILIESIYFTCFSLFYIYNGKEFLSSLLLNPGLLLGVRLLLCLGSLLISVIILRHLLNRRR
jgi:hypothetical protein